MCLRALEGAYANFFLITIYIITIQLSNPQVLSTKSTNNSITGECLPGNISYHVSSPSGCGPITPTFPLPTGTIIAAITPFV